MEDINEDDFLVRVRPFRDGTGEWTGDIDLSVITLPGNDMTDEDYSQLIHFCTMMASTVPIMEHNEELRNLVHDFVTKSFDIEAEPVVQDKPEVEHDGNIIKINFNTRTEGSA